jgi:hypothetical protein
MIYHQWHGDQTYSTHNKGCNFAYRKSRHNIDNWDEHDSITFIIINNYLNNNVVSHVHIEYTTRSLARVNKTIFESQGVVTKTFSRNNIQTLKMREDVIISKHIHTFRSKWEHLSIVGALIFEMDIL